MKVLEWFNRVDILHSLRSYWGCFILSLPHDWHCLRCAPRAGSHCHVQKVLSILKLTPILYIIFDQSMVQTVGTWGHTVQGKLAPYGPIPAYVIFFSDMGIPEVFHPIGLIPRVVPAKPHTNTHRVNLGWFQTRCTNARLMPLHQLLGGFIPVYLSHHHLISTDILDCTKNQMV